MNYFTRLLLTRCSFLDIALKISLLLDLSFSIASDTDEINWLSSLGVPGAICPSQIAYRIEPGGEKTAPVATSSHPHPNGDRGKSPAAAAIRSPFIIAWIERCGSCCCSGSHSRCRRFLFNEFITYRHQQLC